ncbi:MAG: TonB-dependent receptor [Pontiella sp.]
MRIKLFILISCFVISIRADFTDTRTIEELLWEDPAVLINRQGLAQQDLSIRGSSYTGSGLSINGLNLKVPYSAHFNSELPLPGNLLSNPAAQSGLGNASGHLIGTAAFTTIPRTPSSQFSAGIGTEEHYQASFFGTSENVGGFLDWEKARNIDYEANDFERFSGSALVQFYQNDWMFDIMTAGQSKEFGAQGYYGIPSTVYAEERTDDSLIFFGATKGDLDDYFLRASAAMREFDDEYVIPTSLFYNQVLSRFGSAAIEARTMEIQHIALNVRGDLEHERVSGSLGNHDRTKGSLLLMPEVRFEQITLKAGLNSVFQTSESAEWLPVAEIDWFATDNSSIYASYTETVQQPDYQTLYYTDPFRSGNSSLQQQASQNSELGFRQFLSGSLDWRAAAFYRRVENASDWTQTAAGASWIATDLGTIDVTGLDSSINYRPSDELNLQAYYQWTNKDEYTIYAGLYELDFPEHLLTFSGDWRFTREFLLFAAQTLRYQTANNARTSSDFGAEASLGLQYFPRFANNVRLSFLVDNLWGTNFQAIPGLKPRPTSIYSGITVAW